MSTPQINHFRPKLIQHSINPSLQTGVKLVNKHTAGRLNAHNAKVNIYFLDSFLHSFKDDKNEFSNFVHRLGINRTYIGRNIISLKEDPSQIANEVSAIDVLHRENGSRIKRILSHESSRELIDKFDDSIFESVVNKEEDFFDPNGKGRFRVFSLYAIDPKNINGSQNLVIILLDPYHLVCPIANKRHNWSRKENMDHIYQRYKTEIDSLEDIFKNDFVNEEKINFVSLDVFMENL